MANWEKLNKEFDEALDSMTKEDWDNWYKNVEQKRINQNKMTAVEWLEEELKANLKKVILESDSELMESLFEQAKEMQKEQIIETARYYFHEQGKLTPEQYYETFK